MRRVVVPLGLSPEAVRPLAPARGVRLGGPTMGVAWSLQAQAPPAISDRRIGAAVEDACARVVSEMSAWEPGSDLCRFNRAPPQSWVSAPEHLLRVVAAGLQAAELSGGAFDPTLGQLVDLWGFGPPGPAPGPPAASLLQAAQCGWRTLRLDLDGGRLWQPGGVALDLSGIAKGYAVDLAAQALEELGLTHVLIELGGELRGSGVKANGEPWWVEIERPPGLALAEPPILVALHGLAVATSGDWRRTFAAHGRRYAHTIDPATRAPTRSGLAQVSVLHPQCMAADAFCTALMVLGPAAPSFAEAHGLMAHLVTRDPPGEWISPSLRALMA